MVRITQSLLSNQILFNLQNNMKRITDIQDQLSTGRRINRPGDDPVDYPTALNLRSAIQQGRSYQRNITSARTNLELTETNMDSLTNTLQKVRTLAVQGGNDSDPDARLAIAQEVSEMFGQVMDLANANYNGQYIFGGSETKEMAFENKEGAVLYNGDDYSRKVGLSEGTKVTTNLNGFETFLHTPNQITSQMSLNDTEAPLAEQLRMMHPDFPNLPPLPEKAASSTKERSPNPNNSPSPKPNNYASFSIYGTEIKVDLSVDSLEDVVNRINAKVKDVTASINSNNQMVITSHRSDALKLEDGERPIGFEGDPPFGANILSALGMHRRVDGNRNLAVGYPAMDPLADPTESPAPERANVKLQNDTFLFAQANHGPQTKASIPFADNMALTEADAEGNEVVLENGDPKFIEQLEAIRITIDDEVIDLDFRALTQGRDFDGTEGNGDDIPGSTLEDMLELINNHPELKGRATAYINSTGTGIGISATHDSDMFKVENVRKLFGRDITTQVSVDSATGGTTVTQTDPITKETKLDDLPGALVDPDEGGSLGIRRADPMPAGNPPSMNKGLIVIQNNGQSEAVDLREAETIGDVIRAINKSKTGVEAKINSTGTGIDIQSTTGNPDELSIVDMNEGTTARDLGLFSPPSASRIQSEATVTESTTVIGDFPEVSEGSFEIEVRDGSGAVLDTYSIDVSPSDTMEDIAKRIDAIDGKPGAGSGLLSANLEGDRLNIVSNYDGHVINIDPAKDSTGTDSTNRFTSLVGINKYMYVDEEDVNPLVPYESKQSTASILGINHEGTIQEVEEKNVFRSIKELERALREDDTEGIQESLDNLDFDLEKILSQRTTVGARMNRLDSTESRLQEGEDFMRQQLSSIEDADLAETITDYTLAQNAFNAALQASSGIIQRTLLDFLR